jgi:hypothetical protein
MPYTLSSHAQYEDCERWLGQVDSSRGAECHWCAVRTRSCYRPGRRLSCFGVLLSYPTLPLKTPRAAPVPSPFLHHDILVRAHKASDAFVRYTPDGVSCHTALCFVQTRVLIPIGEIWTLLYPSISWSMKVDAACSSAVLVDTLWEKTHFRFFHRASDVLNGQLIITAVLACSLIRLKDKVSLYTPRRHIRRARAYLNPFLPSALYRDEWSTSRPDLHPGKEFAKPDGSQRRCRRFGEEENFLSMPAYVRPVASSLARLLCPSSSWHFWPDAL